MVAALEADPELVMVYGDALYTDAESRQTGYARLARLGPAADGAQLRQPRGAAELDVAAERVGAGRAVRRARLLLLRLRALPPALGARPGEADRAAVVDLPRASGVEDGRRPGRARRATTSASPTRSSRATGCPAELRPYAREGRARARVAAGNNLYGQLELGLARRCLWGALLIDPRAASPSLALKSLLPKPIVRRLRARRNAARRG